MAQESKSWNIVASNAANNTVNPIRRIVDQLNIPCNPNKKLIPLSIGDPSVFGNMSPACTVLEALSAQLGLPAAAPSTASAVGVAAPAAPAAPAPAPAAPSHHGYPPSTGYLFSRQAVAQRFATPTAPLTADDVVLASGCSGALELVMAALANPGDNILVPIPGFSLYLTIAGNKGFEARSYPLLPERDWEIDLAVLESRIDARTRAIIVNNPSNPCGSVFSEAHLRALVDVARRHCVPLISDEVYANMVFSGEKFIPIASVADEVPVFTVGGIAKQYLVPGWRLGWVLVHDPAKHAAQAKAAINQLSQVILGPNSLVQAALPEIFDQTPASYYSDLNQQLEAQARGCIAELQGVPGLRLITPRGAMYLMIGLDIDRFKDISDDLDFSQKLLREQSVFVLPGQCFRATNFFRIVFCAPKEMLSTACARIAEFCREHLKSE